MEHHRSGHRAWAVGSLRCSVSIMTSRRVSLTEGCFSQAIKPREYWSRLESDGPHRKVNDQSQFDMTLMKSSSSETTIGTSCGSKKRRPLVALNRSVFFSPGCLSWGFFLYSLFDQHSALTLHHQ